MLQSMMIQVFRLVRKTLPPVLNNRSVRTCQPMKMLSKRAEYIHESYRKSLKYSSLSTIGGNVYHPTDNPSGILDMSVSENHFAVDTVMKKLEEPKFIHHDPSMYTYGPFRGTSKFRESVATFLTEKLRSNIPLTAENIIVTAGTTTALEYLTYVISDEEECFLCPAPYYSAIQMDVDIRNKCKLLSVPLTNADSYKLTADKLEAALQAAKRQGRRVRGILLINPNNPIGTVYSEETLTQVMEWAKSHQLHVISDEVYALSIYKPGVKFTSVCALSHLPDPQRTHIIWGFSKVSTSVCALSHLPDPQRTHIIWGFSKDFGLSGIRMGFVVSWNQEILDTISKVCYFSEPPGIIQHKLDCLIQDKEWLDNVFFPSNLSQLRKTSKCCVEFLRELGVDVVEPEGGLYVWANFSRCLGSVTMETVKKLGACFLKAGVFLDAADVYHSDELGWFRIVFSHKEDRLAEGLSRIGKAVAMYNSAE